MFFVDLSRKCPAAIPMMSFDTAGKSDAEVMLLYGMREEESMSTYLTRTKGLIVLMAAVMQVGGPCILFSSLVFYQNVKPCCHFWVCYRIGWLFFYFDVFLFTFPADVRFGGTFCLFFVSRDSSKVYFHDDLALLTYILRFSGILRPSYFRNRHHPAYQESFPTLCLWRRDGDGWLAS